MSPILTDSKAFSITAVAGTVSREIAINNAILMQIYINPATSSTTYDIKINDENGKTVYHEEDETGLLNDIIEIPTYGNQTVVIENASADEAFSFVITYRRA